VWLFILPCFFHALFPFYVTILKYLLSQIAFRPGLIVMSRLLVKKYADLFSAKQTEKLLELFDADAQIVDHEGNMIATSALPGYLATLPDEAAFRVHRVLGKNGQFTALGCLEHSGKSIRVAQAFRFRRGRIVSLTMKKI